MRYFHICALLLLALATQCAPREEAAGTSSSLSPNPSASPTASTVPVAAVTPPPTVAPTASPSEAASATPSATPSAAPTTDPNAPAILSLTIDKIDVRAGDTVSGRIVTSLSVASVEARIAGFGIPVPKVAPGQFALSYTVPDVPFFLRKSYEMDIIARNTAGTAVRRTVTINVR